MYPRRRTTSRVRRQPKAYSRPRRTVRRRSMPSYRGQGAYSAPKSAAWGERAGEALGGVLGLIPQTKAFSAPLGALASKLGGFLGNKLGTYMGWGDYAVSMNSLLVPEGNSPASMHSEGKTVRICHREYLGDVFSSNTIGEFAIDNFQVNPANSKAFPWLWNIAVNFQKYKLHGAIVEFKSSSGDALTTDNTGLGTVLIASNYNCADPNFINRQQMENTQYTSSAKPSISFVHIIECDPKLQAQTSLYTAAAGVPPTGVGINEVNWVNVQVATLGCQGAGVNLGSVYLTYDVELIQPINQIDGSIFRGDWFEFSGSDAVYANNNIPNNIPDPENSLGGDVTGGDTYRFAPYLQTGSFRVTYYVTGGAEATSLPQLPSFAGTNCQIYGLTYQATSTNSMMVSWTIKLTEGIASFFLSEGTYPCPEPLTGYLAIDQIDADL